MSTILGREPAVFFGAVAAAIVALINIFHPLDQGTIDSINSIVLFVGPIVVGLVTRFFVTPTASAA